MKCFEWMEDGSYRQYTVGRVAASVGGFDESMPGRQAADVMEARGEEVFDAARGSRPTGRPRAKRYVLAVLRYLSKEGSAPA